MKPSAGNGAAALIETFNLQEVALVEATIVFGLTTQFLSNEVIDSLPFEAVPMSKSMGVFEPGVTDEVLAQTPDSAPFVEEKNVPVESVTENRRNLRKSRTVVW